MEDYKSEFERLELIIIKELRCDIRGRSRKVKNKHIMARVIFSHIAREQIKSDINIVVSYEKIADFLGINHTTALHYLYGINGQGSTYDNYHYANLCGFNNSYKRINRTFNETDGNIVNYSVPEEKVIKKDLWMNIGLTLGLTKSYQTVQSFC